MEKQKGRFKKIGIGFEEDQDQRFGLLEDLKRRKLWDSAPMYQCHSAGTDDIAPTPSWAELVFLFL